MNRIRLASNNESAWNFLKGLLEYENFSITQFPDVEEFCEELYNAGNRSPYLLAFLVDLNIEKTLKVYEANSYEDAEAYSRKVFDFCDNLANSYDSIRQKYWKYIADKFRHDKDVAKYGANRPKPEEVQPNEEDDEEIEHENPEKESLVNGNGPEK